MRPGLPILLSALLAALGCAQGAAAPSAAEKASPDVLPAAVAPEAAAPPDQPATHMGRVLLPRVAAIVRGQVTQVMPAAHGTLVAHVRPSEWLRGEPRDDGSELVVLTAATDLLPSVGRDALFVLGARPRSDNFEVLEVGSLADEGGPARLAGMRKYLEIEAVADPAARVAALRAYLRGALAAEDRWTRSNAAREFGALASEMPGTLTAEDRPPLQSALDRTRDRALRDLLQSALAACPGTSSRGPRPAGETATVATDGLAAATARFDAKEATVPQRRQAVVDAAIGSGAGAAPLVERALGDESPAVREAAAAAAGQLRIASLEPRIATMLTGDPSPVVRRTLVVAAGYLRSRSSVATLAVLAAEDAPFAKEAAFALARVRDDAALAELRRLGAAAKDAERRELLAFLASDRFVEQERALAEQR